MSSYSSYKNQNLANKIVHLNQELVSLKAKQLYGMKDIQIFTSNTVSQASHTWTGHSYDGSYTWTDSSTNCLLLRFTGDKPSKTVVGELQWSSAVSQQGDTDPYVVYYKKFQGSTQNVLEWLILISGGTDFYGSYAVFTAVFKVVSNDTGVLSIENSYDAETYQDWLFG